MFKYRKSIKNQILLKLKDKVIFYMTEMNNYNDRKLIWENKTYETDSDVKNCISKEQYEKRRNEQIKWSYEQWLMNYHKLNVVKDMIEDINKL